MNPRRRAPLLLSFAAGCLIPNPAYDGSSGSSGSLTSSGTTTTPPTTEHSTSAASSTAGSASASGTGFTSELTSTGNASATSTSTTDWATDTTPSSSGAIEPVAEHLQHYQGGCNTPQWCHEADDFWKPISGTVWSQACFPVTLEPPYQLVRVGYWVAAKAGDLSGDTRIQVHERVGGAPGPLLGEQLVDPNISLIMGYNEVPFAPPLTINSANGVCIGLVGGRKFPSGAALGIALDGAISGPGQSFSKVDGLFDCTVPSWTDHTAFNPPKKTWCIDADVVTAP